MRSSGFGALAAMALAAAPAGAAAILDTNDPSLSAADGFGMARSMPAFPFVIRDSGAVAVRGFDDPLVGATRATKFALRWLPRGDPTGGSGDAAGRNLSASSSVASFAAALARSFVLGGPSFSQDGPRGSNGSPWAEAAGSQAGGFAALRSTAAVVNTMGQAIFLPVNVVPEPGNLALFGTALLGLAATRRRGARVSG